jgi:cupin 2 domain-containing protein
VGDRVNLFQLPAMLSAGEVAEELWAGRGVLIEKIVSQGHSSPPGFWYDQTRDEWVALIQGRARLAWENGRTLDMEAGNYLFIPAHERHRVEWTSQDPPCIWLAVHGQLTGPEPEV